jgi:hypothetical protein
VALPSEVLAGAWQAVEVRPELGRERQGIVGRHGRKEKASAQERGGATWHHRPPHEKGEGFRPSASLLCRSDEPEAHTISGTSHPPVSRESPPRGNHALVRNRPHPPVSGEFLKGVVVGDSVRGCGERGISGGLVVQAVRGDF